MTPLEQKTQAEEYATNLACALLELKPENFLAWLKTDSDI
jgi:hypothetical protein